MLQNHAWQNAWEIMSQVRMSIRFIMLMLTAIVLMKQKIGPEQLIWVQYWY